MKKYELVPQENTQLFRIRALRDIPEMNVKAGDLGGYIEEEYNLSHHGNCWVYEDAEVSGNARICGNARISGDVRVTTCYYVRTSSYSITFTDTHVFIGCVALTWEEWAERGLEIGEKVEVTNSELKVFSLLFQAYSVIFKKDLKFPVPDSVK
jgi:hypothetical protein